LRTLKTITLNVRCSCGKTAILYLGNGPITCSNPAWQYHFSPAEQEPETSRLWNCGGDDHVQDGLATRRSIEVIVIHQFDGERGQMQS
jgi:hypothetical protein